MVHEWESWVALMGELRLPGPSKTSHLSSLSKPLLEPDISWAHAEATKTSQRTATFRLRNTNPSNGTLEGSRSFQDAAWSTEQAGDGAFSSSWEVPAAWRCQAHALARGPHPSPPAPTHRKCNPVALAGAGQNVPLATKEGKVNRN